MLSITNVWGKPNARRVEYLMDSRYLLFYAIALPHSHAVNIAQDWCMSAHDFSCDRLIQRRGDLLELLLALSPITMS